MDKHQLFNDCKIILTNDPFELEYLFAPYVISDSVLYHAEKVLTDDETFNLCKFAISLNPIVFRFIPNDYFKQDIYVSLCDHVIDCECTCIQLVHKKFLTMEMCMKAVSGNLSTLMFIDNKVFSHIDILVKVGIDIDKIEPAHIGYIVWNKDEKRFCSSKFYEKMFYRNPNLITISLDEITQEMVDYYIQTYCILGNYISTIKSIPIKFINQNNIHIIATRNLCNLNDLHMERFDPTYYYPTELDIDKLTNIEKWITNIFVSNVTYDITDEGIKDRIQNVPIKYRKLVSKSVNNKLSANSITRGYKKLTVDHINQSIENVKKYIKINPFLIKYIDDKYLTKDICDTLIDMDYRMIGFFSRKMITSRHIDVFLDKCIIGSTLFMPINMLNNDQLLKMSTKIYQYEPYKKPCITQQTYYMINRENNIEYKIGSLPDTHFNRRLFKSIVANKTFHHLSSGINYVLDTTHNKISTDMVNFIVRMNIHDSCSCAIIWNIDWIKYGLALAWEKKIQLGIDYDPINNDEYRNKLKDMPSETFTSSRCVFWSYLYNNMTFPMPFMEHPVLCKCIMKNISWIKNYVINVNVANKILFPVIEPSTWFMDTTDDEVLKIIKNSFNNPKLKKSHTFKGSSYFSPSYAIKRFVEGLNDSMLGTGNINILAELDGEIIDYVPRKKCSPETYIIALKTFSEAARYLQEEYFDEELCNDMITNDPLSIQFIPHNKLTHDMCLFTLNLDGLALQYLPLWAIDDTTTLIAVKNNGLAIQYIHENFHTIHLAKCAIMNNPLSFRYFSDKLKKDHHLHTFAITHDVKTLQYMINPTYGTCRYAIEVYWPNIKYIANPTEQMCLKAINGYHNNRIDKLDKCCIPIVSDKVYDALFGTTGRCSDFVNDYRVMNDKMFKNVIRHTDFVLSV